MRDCLSYLHPLLITTICCQSAIIPYHMGRRKNAVEVAKDKKEQKQKDHFSPVGN